MTGQTRFALRAVPAAWGLLLTATATVVAAIACLVTGHLTLLILTLMLLGSTGLQWLGSVRESARGEGPDLLEEALDEVEEERVSVRGADRVAAAHRQDLQALQDELHLPLRVLARLGRHLGESGGERVVQAAEALEEEGRRLARLLEKRVAGAEDPARQDRVSMETVLRRLVEGHSCFLQTLGIHAGVRFAHRKDAVRGDRRALLAALEVLLGETLVRLRPEEELKIRTRDVAGLFSLQVCGVAAESRPEPPTLEYERACQVIGLHGGEVWAEEEGWCGFGLTLPLLAGAARHRPVRPARRGEAEEAA